MLGGCGLVQSGCLIMPLCPSPSLNRWVWPGAGWVWPGTEWVFDNAFMSFPISKQVGVAWCWVGVAWYRVGV